MKIDFIDLSILVKMFILESMLLENDQRMILLHGRFPNIFNDDFPDGDQ